MSAPLVSICIPTYNRAVFLRECLQSITNQFSDQEIKNNVNVFILDNQSEDNTSEIVKEFTNSFENITYVIDSEKRGIVQGIIKVSEMGNGEYIWVLSDDDLIKSNGIKKVLNFINHKTDIIICNLSDFFKKEKKDNLLKISQDFILKNKRELFKILEKKFPIAFDYYATLCSNWLIRKKIIESHKEILKRYDSSLDMFPIPSIFFYSSDDFTSGVIADCIILNRGGNESWNKKNPLKKFLQKKIIWNDYYDKILNNNELNVSKIFKRNVRARRYYHVIEFLKQEIVYLLRKLGIYEKIKRMLKK